MKKVLGAFLLISLTAGVHAQTLAQRKSAAEQTASSTTNFCYPLQPFYWEVGNATARLDYDTVGGLLPAAGQLLSIASASKWIWGAYVAEKKQTTTLSTQDMNFLRMTSGYMNLAGDCQSFSTINGCLASGSNATQSSSWIGKFFYNSGHFEVQAVEDASAPSSPTNISLGSLTNAQLGTELKSVLGTYHTFGYGQPLPAGGLAASGSDYGAFLRDILSGTLYYANQVLGTNTICTSPDCVPTVVPTPIPSGAGQWYYSMGHWVEPDGTYSSAGSRGFYPWIDSGKQWYGVVARSVDPSDNTGYASAQCGKQIRDAWISGVAQ